MDEFCKGANIFTNREAKLKHQINHSRKLHKVYETSLGNATKTFPEMPEVFGMNDFLKPLPRDDDDKKKKGLLVPSTQKNTQVQLQQQYQIQKQMSSPSKCSNNSARKSSLGPRL